VSTDERHRDATAAPARRVLQLRSWLVLFWAVSALVLLSMRWEALVGLEFGDTDDWMRLVQTRDLLSGQGWFDRTQDRLAPPAGVEMHWSRLPDAAIGSLILLAQPFVGEATAERFAVAAWPLLLLLAWFTLLAILGRHLARREGGLAALFLGLLALPATAQFLPARIDHHGLQMVLTLALVASMIAVRTYAWAGAAAGAVAVLMMTIGLESLPIFLAAELALAIFWAREPLRFAPALRLHALALAIGAVAGLAVTFPLADWTQLRCDSYSMVYVVALLFGSGLWAVIPAVGATLRLARPAARLGLLAGTALGAGVLLLLLFPECRSGPYGMLDDQLVDLWLSRVTEAQSAAALLRDNPGRLMSFLGFPVAALAGLVLAFRREGLRAEWIVIGACFLAALLTALWQIRGSFFANGLAVLPAVYLVTSLLDAARRLARPSLRLVASIAVLTVINGLPFSVVGQAIGPEEAAANDDDTSCKTGENLTPLDGLEPSLVLASIDLGPMILLRTPHSVLAAPYHRNTEGLRSAIEIWTAAPATAYQRLLDRDIDYIVVCAARSDIDLRIFAGEAPDGLAARLLSGARPHWLDPVRPAAAASFDVFRIKPIPLPPTGKAGTESP